MTGGTRDLFSARIFDALEKGRRGRIACVPFLTPREVRAATRLLESAGAGGELWFWGGYPGAERACLFLLPDYLLSCLESPPMQSRPDAVAALIEDELQEAVRAVRIKGSGYRVLSHRDYLGSILGLGLERDALGDIAIQNDFEAVVFCSARICDFLTENLTKVANDKVRCRAYVPDEAFTDGRRYEPINDTVASARLDCVVAALTNLSREAAQELIRSGLVEVDFEPTDRTDLPLSPPVTLSLRGYGRFLLRSFDGETRKGRLRMRADKMI